MDFVVQFVNVGFCFFVLAVCRSVGLLNQVLRLNQIQSIAVWDGTGAVLGCQLDGSPFWFARAVQVLCIVLVGQKVFHLSSILGACSHTSMLLWGESGEGRNIW